MINLNLNDVEKYLHPQRISVVEHLFKFCDSVKIYKCNLNNFDVVNKHIKMSRSVYRYDYDKCLIFISENADNIVIIIFDWSSLKYIVEFVKDNFIKGDSIDVQLAEHTIRNFLTANKNTELLSLFKSTCSKECFTLYDSIVPDKYILNGHINDIPPDNKPTVITQSIFYLDMNNRIISLKINKPHPNSDEEGYFCLGDLKLLELNEENLKRIIENIKVYKLDDCYWRPNF